MRGNRAGLRVGVVGVGYWGSRHVRVLRSTTGVAAVIGVDSRFRQVDEGVPQIDHGIAAYADIEDALPHVDAVIIATSPASHALLGQKAIAAGKHVLIEKPLATTAEAARSLVDAAAAASCSCRATPSSTTQQSTSFVISCGGGEIGRPFYLDCARLNLGLYQTDVNVILDLAPHDISISNFVFGSPPTTVTAWGSRYVHPQHEDVAYLRLDYADLGVRTNIHVSWLDPHKVRRVTAVGSKKMVVYNDMADGERIRVYDKSAISPGEGDGPLSQFAYHLGDIVSPFIPFAEPLAVQDQHFIDCVANGSRPSVEGSSGLAVVQVLECAQISLREQRPVALTEVTQRPYGRLAHVADAR